MSLATNPPGRHASPPPAEDAAPWLEATVQQFSRMLRSLGRRFRLPEAEQDELVQEVRIRLWRAGARGESPAAVNTSYVYRAAMSAAIDLVRQRRGRRAAATDHVEVTHVADSRTHSSDEVEGKEVMQAYARALDTLAPARRIAVDLHLRGYDREEIAALTGQTVTQVRNLVFRGMSELRILMAEYRPPTLGPR